MAQFIENKFHLNYCIFYIFKNMDFQLSSHHIDLLLFT